jgi:hypothetical protein
VLASGVEEEHGDDFDDFAGWDWWIFAEMSVNSVSYEKIGQSPDVVEQCPDDEELESKAVAYG